VTTRVGGSTKPAPHSTTPPISPRIRVISERCWASSASADSPLMASRLPPRFSKGKLHFTSLSSGATARAVTNDDEPTVRTTSRSSARPRTTRTRSSRPRSCTASVRKSVLRSDDSTRSTSRSGRTQATARPGNPAPVPMSTSRPPDGSNSLRATELSRCRSHNRGTSQGPMSPRTVPGPASHPAYRPKIAIKGANLLLTTAGGAGATGSACRPVERPSVTAPAGRRPDGPALRPRTR